MYVAQLAQERERSDQRIAFLEAEKTELEHKLTCEKRRGDLLELELAEAHNTNATHQTDIAERERLLNLLKDINDKTSAAFNRLGLEGTKKERKPRVKNGKPKKGKADNGQSADKPTPAAG